ncbi:hypothetical protein RFI_15389 [Reticulomyxa filosa]|uniref:Uncharacterized protein n=1 Tax=Reticulomyxa filosa TaxID=46433 RepID=X6N6A5_RETFI|nr:hypothetical protein RFI_15389 [Reticulomyxa filosa]|eukprot:ETO21815.1 hypothetical protein RFI_15389 [Reticulomyxa filosa]
MNDLKKDQKQYLVLQGYLTEHKMKMKATDSRKKKFKKFNYFLIDSSIIFGYIRKRLKENPTKMTKKKPALYVMTTNIKKISNYDISSERQMAAFVVKFISRVAVKFFQMNRFIFFKYVSN